MPRRLVAAFLLMGVSFTVLQSLMIRELLVSFSGNELSIGLILGAWLILEALGSGLAGRLARRIPARSASYAWLQVALALLLLPSLLVALRVRSLVGAVPGEMIAPGPSLLAALLVLAPLGLVDGAMFATACRVRRPAGHVYALEAAGSIVGGIAFTYLLLPLLTSTQILLLVAGLNLASACSLFLVGPRRQAGAILTAGFLSIIALVAAISPLGADLHQRAVAGRWGAYRLAYEGNSIYGNIAIIDLGGQITVMANGTPVLTAPDPDIATVEQLTHLPILFLEGTTRRILVIGGGAGGVLGELLRYPLERLDYAELDPLLIQALQEVPTTLTMEELSDPRLHLALEDGRLFVRKQTVACASDRAACPAYDLILVNLPHPSTLVLNRLYTQEFFELLRPLLAPEGLLALPAPPARTYMGAATHDMLVCYGRTLRSVFPHTRAIPGDGLTLWLASPEQPLNLDIEEVVRRWEVRGVDAHVLTGDYLRYLLDKDVQARFESDLWVDGQYVEVNRDEHPAGLRYALAYESALLSPELEPLFRILGQLRWGHVAMGIAGLTLLGLFLLRRRQGLVAAAIATTGVAGMTVDMLVLFAFQVLYGYVYQQVGLLITAFMAGLSVGGLAMTVWAKRIGHPWRALTLLETAITLAWAGLAGLFVLLLQRSTPSSSLEHILLLAMNGVAGMLVGLEFPLANQILAEGRPEQGRLAGFLYACDLFGATVGAVVVSAVLLPALGLVETALLAVLLKAGSLLLVGTALWRGRPR